MHLMPVPRPLQTWSFIWRSHLDELELQAGEKWSTVISGCCSAAKFWKGICMIHKLLNFFVSEFLLKGAWTECQKFFEMPLLWATLAIGGEKSHVKSTPIPELTGSWRSTRWSEATCHIATPTPEELQPQSVLRPEDHSRRGFNECSGSSNFCIIIEWQPTLWLLHGWAVWGPHMFPHQAPMQFEVLGLDWMLDEWVLQVESTWPVTYVMGFQRVSFKQSGPSHRMDLHCL